MQILSNGIFYFSFSVEIILASLLFAHFFRLRKYGGLFFAAGTALMFLVAYFWQVEFGVGWIRMLSLTFKYIVFYLIIMVTLFFTFQCGIWGAVFCATMGYCVQHITYNTYRLFSWLVGIATSDITGNYADDLLHLAWFVLVYLALVGIVSRKYGKSKDIMQRQFMENGKVIGLAAFFLITATFLDNFSYEEIYRFDVPDLFFLVNLYLSIIAAGIAYMLLSVLKEERTMEELSSMKLLLHSQERVYRNSKELIDSLNLKAHDLKHQIHGMEGRIPTEEAREIEELVNLYDAALHTGSEALDIVLAEKGAHCVNNGIHLSCLLDGSLLSGISDTDIYSFFGNALDNAIDAVDSLPAEKRIVSVTGKKQGGFLNIRIENYCQGGTAFGKDGLPQTPRDIRYHGFGTKSMKHIAEKYGASLFFKQESERFVVNLLLPVRPEKQD